VEEGRAATSFFVLIDGEIVVSKRVGDRDIETSRTTRRGTFCGAVASFLDNQPDTYAFSVRALAPCRFVVIDAEAFGEFMRSQFPIAVHLLRGMSGDNEDIQSSVDSQNRIKAVGRIAAGLAHGLNNPAAATVRAAADLRSRVSRLTHDAGPSRSGRDALRPLLEELSRRAEVQSRSPIHPSCSVLETSQAEDDVTDWLEDHRVAQPWDLAPVFVAAGLRVTDLESVVGRLTAAGPPDRLDDVFRWLRDVVEAQLLIADIADAGERISELVDASKHYSHLDGSDYDVVDLHKLLDSTLDVLSPILADDIAVVREYDPLMPGVPCYPGELTQALTHIVSNAIEAMRRGQTDGRTLTLRTQLSDAVTIDVGDTGPGIDPSICDHIFDPFFTTKSIGEGAGLGLTVAWRIIATRHGGTLAVRSTPGDTHFTIGLPSAHVEAC
jgi:signal transduction histidine kinase